MPINLWPVTICGKGLFFGSKDVGEQFGNAIMHIDKSFAGSVDCFC